LPGQAYLLQPEEIIMADANIIELTDANFDSEVLRSDLPILVDFWAVWCGPCRQVAPTVAKLASEYQGKLKVGKMDIDHHQITPQQFGIRSIPTLLLFKGGQVAETIIGAMPESKIVAKIKPHIG
jgi:thioredoxin 1